MQRLREIDFLRGVAIILVLFRHQFLFTFTKNMGWIGVDLFFVLSGFLVSGLLFKEYLKFGDIRPKNFLIRRGFKIYPIYYIFYLLYLIPLLYNGDLRIGGILTDLTFTQNYTSGWGYAISASWSLAIEEHFYFGLCFFLWWGIKHNKIRLEKADNDTGKIELGKALPLVMAFCLFLRLLSNLAFPDQQSFNFVMTHLRIDSLLAGVFISYLFYFRRDDLTKLFQPNKYLLMILAILGLVWTPFFDPTPSFFVKTIGFSLLYISFGIFLTYFLLTGNINQKLNRVFSTPVVNIVSKVGYCSYSIYIIHLFVNWAVEKIILNYNLYHNKYLTFLLTSLLSIIFGIIMTHRIERYFLKIRDKYYPSRAERTLVMH